MRPPESCRAPGVLQEPYNDPRQPYEALYSPTEPFGALWSPTSGYRALWSPIEPYGALRSPMGPYGAVWGPTETYGALWSPMEPYGACEALHYRALWSPTEPYGGLITEPYGAGPCTSAFVCLVKGHIRGFVPNQGLAQVHWVLLAAIQKEPYRALWSPKELYGYGALWSHMEPYWSLRSSRYPLILRP